MRQSLFHLSSQLDGALISAFLQSRVRLEDCVIWARTPVRPDWPAAFAFTEILAEQVRRAAVPLTVAVNVFRGVISVLLAGVPPHTLSVATLPCKVSPAHAARIKKEVIIPLLDHASLLTALLARRQAGLTATSTVHMAPPEQPPVFQPLKQASLYKEEEAVEVSESLTRKTPPLEPVVVSEVAAGPAARPEEESPADELSAVSEGQPMAEQPLEPVHDADISEPVRLAPNPALAPVSAALAAELPPFLEKAFEEAVAGAVARLSAAGEAGAASALQEAVAPPAETRPAKAKRAKK